MIIISLVNISQQKQLQNFLVIRTFKSTLRNFQRGNMVLLTIVTVMLLSRFSRVQLCVTPQTAAHQAPPSLGFSRQEH